MFAGCASDARRRPIEAGKETRMSRPRPAQSPPSERARRGRPDRKNAPARQCARRVRTDRTNPQCRIG
jgi:hypothetical protein